MPAIQNNKQNKYFESGVLANLKLISNNITGRAAFFGIKYLKAAKCSGVGLFVYKIGCTF
jgi:hypothetical protein